MAKKQRNAFVDPPTASSSDDDEAEISESAEEEDSSDEEEPIKSPVKIPSTAITKAASGKSTVVSAANQSSDSDSGSETETDTEPEATDPPKSGSGKTVSAGKLSKNDSTVAVATPVAKSGTKRPARERPPSKDNKKRAKIVTSGKEESIKKPAFKRLWAEEDDVSVLQGMINYADTGKSPFEDKNGFYEFLKKSITFEASKNQFMEKIKSLRRKFMGKNCKNGAEPKFANAHNQKTYNLSKLIWGPDGIAPKSIIKSVGVLKTSQCKKKELDGVKQDLVFVASPNGKKVEDNDKDWFDNSFLLRSIASFGVDERFLKEKWSLVADEEKKKVEEKLKQLQANEFQFILKKIAFVHDVTSMTAEASKNNP